MFPLLLTLFILVSLVLVIVVLMQSSKGGGLAGAFGGAGSDSSVLGGRGAASLLSKITVYLAAAFMLLALMLAVVSSRAPVEQATQEGGVVQRAREAGALDAYQVDENANVLDQLKLENTQETPEEIGAEGDDAPPPAPEG